MANLAILLDDKRYCPGEFLGRNLSLISFFLAAVFCGLSTNSTSFACGTSLFRGLRFMPLRVVTGMGLTDERVLYRCGMCVLSLDHQDCV